VLGLPATLAGAAVSLSLILDGFADPIMGSLSDRTRSRLGRRHPYMYAAPLPIALSLVAIFNPPQGLEHLWLFAWFFTFVVTLRVFMAAYHTPHLALGGELSPDYTERTRIMSYNTVMGSVASMVMAFVALSIFFRATPEYPRGLLNPDAYPPFAAFSAGIALALLLASAWFTRDRIPSLPQPPANLPKVSPFEFLKDLGKAITNRNYAWLLVAYFFLSLTLGLRAGLSLYVNTFFWELTSEHLRWFVLGALGGAIFGGALVTRLHQKLDKRSTIVIGCLGLAGIPALPIALRFLGLMPPNATVQLVVALLTFSLVTATFTAIIQISVMSVLADIADENELKHGHRQEGVLYSTRALFAKIDMALGQFLAGVALDLIAFPPKAVPGQVPDDVLFKLAMIEGPAGAVPGLLAAFFYARYRITRARHAEIRAELEARRGRMGAAPAGAPVGAGVAAPAAPAE
ncbi:MAG: MFS transporter, partial [Phenylobacterium sp.]|jgi:Na+/melibiose symporter-like transporter|uniref:MFS transporter n=1 Tax=Phenylobacterium sp. TaxID=1871053 RepID=UPI002A35F8C1